jgi:hypothetical protein
MFLVTNFLDFVKNILEKKTFCYKFLFFWEKNLQKKRTSKNHPKLSQLLTTWNLATLDFLISYFDYHQIWLNILVDDCDLSNITKLKWKRNHWIVVNFVLLIEFWLPIDPNMLSLGMLYSTWALHSCVLQVTIIDRLMKKQIIFWKLSSVWMEILNDMISMLNWSIFKFN